MKKLTALLTGVLACSALSSQPCTKLFFSEYIEGSSFNKAIEIFNPSDVPIDLSSYKIATFFNGATSASTMLLHGVVQPQSTYAICHKQATVSLKSLCQDSTTTVFNFNGNDAIALLNGTDTADIFGQIGSASYWLFGEDSAVNRTLVRNAEVNEGTTDAVLGFTQWTVYPQDDFTHIGSHDFTPCISSADTVIHFSVTSANVTENEGTYTISLSLNQAEHYNDFSVDISLKSASPESAKTDDINEFSDITLIFPKDSSVIKTSISITDDTETETTEMFVFVLRNATNGAILGADSLFTLTVTDDDSIVVSGLPNKTENNRITIYPNPAKNNFTLLVNTTDVNAGITLYNMIGNTVYKQQHTINNGVLNINVNLPNGFYYGTIDNNKTKESFKIEVLH